ncbi:hypothetical protein D918_04673 [Trichuris suis]|nr:hypothetical protein D918_04673 [Trichuris suis]
MKKKKDINSNFPVLQSYTFTRLKKKDTNQKRKWKRVDPKHTSRKLVQTSRRRSGAKWKQQKTKRL